MIDSRNEAKPRPFLVTAGDDCEVDDALKPIIGGRGLYLVFISLNANAYREHAVGCGSGDRKSYQRLLRYIGSNETPAEFYERLVREFGSHAAESV